MVRYIHCQCLLTWNALSTPSANSIRCRATSRWIANKRASAVNGPGLPSSQPFYYYKSFVSHHACNPRGVRPFVSTCFPCVLVFILTCSHESDGDCVH